jgi:hypothetical protein
MTEALRLKLQAEAAMWRQRGDTHLRLLLEEAIAAISQPPAPTAQPAPQPLTTEHHIALREAHAIGASDAYFKAWPTHDNNAGRMLFERGFVRGFDCHARIAAAGITAAPTSRKG